MNSINSDDSPEQRVKNDDEAKKFARPRAAVVVVLEALRTPCVTCNAVAATHQMQGYHFDKGAEHSNITSITAAAMRTKHHPPYPTDTTATCLTPHMLLTLCTSLCILSDVDSLPPAASCSPCRCSRPSMSYMHRLSKQYTGGAGWTHTRVVRSATSCQLYLRCSKRASVFVCVRAFMYACMYSCVQACSNK